MTQSLKDGTRLAKRSFIVLGFVYIIFAITKLVDSFASLFLFPLMMGLAGTIAAELNPIVNYVIALAGIILLVAGYLIVKRNIIGVYLGLLFILVGVVTLFSENISLNILPFIILIYLSYVNYKAYKTLTLEHKNTSFV